MNAVVQSLLHSPAMLEQVCTHERSDKCHEGCAVCLLRISEEATRDASAAAESLPEWSKFVERFDLVFRAQQDANVVFSEVLCDLAHCSPRLPVMHQCWRSLIQESPTCGCRGSGMHQAPSEHASMMALSIPSDHDPREPSCSLRSLLHTFQSWELCETTAATALRCVECNAVVVQNRCLELVDTNEIFVVELKRFAHETDAATKKLHSRRLRMPVSIDEELDLPGGRYMLRGMMLHTGDTPWSGHYRACVRSADAWFLYDDAHCSHSAVVPAEAAENATLLIYERVAPRSPDVFELNETQPSGEAAEVATASAGGTLNAAAAEQREGGGSIEMASAPAARCKEGRNAQPGSLPEEGGGNKAVAPIASAGESVSGTLDGAPKLVGEHASLAADAFVTDVRDTEADPGASKSSSARRGLFAELRGRDGCCTRLCARCGREVCCGTWRFRGSCGPEPEMHECSLCARIHAVFMDADTEAARLERDVRKLLQLWQGDGEWQRFLEELPLFANESSSPDVLHRCASEFHVAMESLCGDSVNSNAALEVRPYIGDAHVYPLAVLMEATAIATGTPMVFLLDTVDGLVNSIFHKELYVSLGRWRSKSRHWTLATGNVGEGKSREVKLIIETMIATLKTNAALAVGRAHDRFHYQQSSTTAAAIDKLRQTEAYLTMHCSDAGRCLDKGAAAGRGCDPHKRVDLDYFLDAAHGDEVSHVTLQARQAAKQRAVLNPKEPVLENFDGLHMDPTNVHVMFMQQEVLFVEFWAQITSNCPVGLAQRFLLSFAGDMDPAPRALNHFMEKVTLPILGRLFAAVLHSVGPRTPHMEAKAFKTTASQCDVVAELEELVKLGRRKRSIHECLKAAMPKSLYWLGTSLLTNHTISSLWRDSVAARETGSVPVHVSDACFASGVAFMHRRYLAGQAVLAVTVSECAWVGRHKPFVEDPGDLTPWVVRALRGLPGPVITMEHLLTLDLESKRALRDPGSAEAQAAGDKLRRVWKLCADVGVGELDRDKGRGVRFRKFRRDALSGQTIKWLHEQRVPGYIFGIAPVSKDPVSAPATGARQVSPKAPTQKQEALATGLEQGSLRATRSLGHEEKSGASTVSQFGIAEKGLASASGDTAGGNVVAAVRSASLSLSAILKLRTTSSSPMQRQRAASFRRRAQQRVLEMQQRAQWAPAS